MATPSSDPKTDNPPTSHVQPSVWMLDLWCIVPYYDAHLCEALVKSSLPVTLISTTYYLDRQCFARHGINPEAGLMDIVGRVKLPKLLRRLFKILEASINTIATMFKALWSRPDLVHIQYLPLLKWDLPVDLWFIRYLNWLAIPVVYTVHDLLPHDTGQKHRAIFHRLYHSLQALICHSEEARQRLEEEFGVSPDRLFVIPHGPFFQSKMRSDSHRPGPELGLGSDKIVLWQGIIFPYKGIEFLLSSWRIVQSRDSNAKLFIAGTGDKAMLTRIRRMVEDYGLDRSVRLDFRFLPLPEMLQLYQMADVVVYPYRAVTTSGALLTGLSQGKAIIATRLPAFEELLEDNKTALLVDYNDVDSLAADILSLLNDDDRREKLEKAVAQKFQSTGWEEIATRTWQCYMAVRRRWLFEY